MKVKVKSFLWQKSVWAGGVEQSGPLVKKVWEDALKKTCFSPKNVLILGLGCGVAAKLISKKFPKAKIMGIEIDPVMINLGQKYFDLDKIPNLKIIEADAFKAVKLLKEKYDLVLVDLYMGDKNAGVPELKLVTTKNSVIISNLLEFNGEYRNRISVVKLPD